MTNDRNFTSEIDEYVVLKLKLDDYYPVDRPIPDRFRLVGVHEKIDVKRDERRLLKLYFHNWQAPYKGQLEGWRTDSPIYLLHDGRLVAGVYLVAGNEFGDIRTWGQLHYSFMAPSYRGRGLYHYLFNQLIERAKSWGLEGIYINTDRYMLPEMYARWGATYWRTFPKPPRRKIREIITGLRGQVVRAKGAFERLLV